ncbi:hypothetical protein COCCADRAFT_93127, partial [Bipolaris zeicola 26-R-13]
PNTFYTLPTEPINNVIVPIKYVPEIKSVPETQLSFIQHNYFRFIGKHTTIITQRDHQLIEKGIKIDLTRFLGHTMFVMQDEASWVFYSPLPNDMFLNRCADWTPIHLYANALRIISFVSGRVFIGLPMSRDERWLKSTIEFTVDTFLGGKKLSEYPRVFWPILEYVLPELRRVRWHYKNVKNLLQPLLEARLQDMEDPDFKRPKDMLQWGIDNSNGNERNIWWQTMFHLKISVAAIHSTGISLYHILFDIAALPDTHEILRQEIADVEAKYGCPLPKVGLTKLHKLDSLMKESQRMNQLNILTMTRKVMKDMKFSDGTTIPKGMFIGVASGAVNRDAEIFDNPNEFDPWRFYKLRQIPGMENQHQFVSTGDMNYNWGHGTHACPGRFFGSNEIKIIVVEFLKNFELKLLAGAKRPENNYWGMEVRPDFGAQMLIRRR